MKNFILIFVILTSVIGLLSGQEVKTKNDFVPPQPPEMPLVEFFPSDSDPRIGFILSSAAVITGVSLTYLSVNSTLEKLLEDPGSERVPRGVILTGASFIGAALFAVLTDFFLDQILYGSDDKDS